MESIEKDSINSDESKGNTANANEPVLSEQDKESIARVGILICLRIYMNI